MTETPEGPTALEIMSALVGVLLCAPPETVDALFIHGSPVRSAELDKKVLSLAANIFHKGQANEIVLNGLTSEACNNPKELGYPGVEVWTKSLNKGYDIPLAVIKTIPQAMHTAAEASNVLDLAVKEGWHSLIITGPPLQLLRAMLCYVWFINQRNLSLKVYTVSHQDLSWNEETFKPALNSGVTAVSGKLKDHIVAEFGRIVKYAETPVANAGGKFPYTQHATLSQLLEYLDKRDSE